MQSAHDGKNDTEVNSTVAPRAADEQFNGAASAESTADVPDASIIHAGIIRSYAMHALAIPAPMRGAVPQATCALIGTSECTTAALGADARFEDPADRSCIIASAGPADICCHIASAVVAADVAALGAKDTVHAVNAALGAHAHFEDPAWSTHSQPSGVTAETNDNCPYHHLAHLSKTRATHCRARRNVTDALAAIA